MNPEDKPKNVNKLPSTYDIQANLARKMSEEFSIYQPLVRYFNYYVGDPKTANRGKAKKPRKV